MNLDAMDKEDAKRVEGDIREGRLDLRILCYEVGIGEIKEAEKRDPVYGERMREWRKRGLGLWVPLGLGKPKGKEGDEKEDEEAGEGGGGKGKGKKTYNTRIVWRDEGADPRTLLYP